MVLHFILFVDEQHTTAPMFIYKSSCQTSLTWLSPRILQVFTYNFVDNSCIKFLKKDKAFILLYMLDVIPTGFECLLRFLLIYELHSTMFDPGFPKI